MTDLFEFSEKIVYIHRYGINLYDITQGKHIRGVQHEVFKADFKSIILNNPNGHSPDASVVEQLYSATGCNGTDIIIIIESNCDKDWLIQTAPQKIEILTYDIDLKLIRKESGKYTKRRLLQDILARVKNISNANIQSIESKLNNPNRIGLPYQSWIIPYEERVDLSPSRGDRQTGIDAYARGISNMCYDKYEDNFVAIFLSGQTYRIDVFENISGGWLLLKKSKFFKLQTSLSRVDKLECTKNYFLIAVHPGWDIITISREIVIMDKKTFTISYKVYGSQPAFYDDYDKWYKNSMNLLKDIDVLNKFSVDLLSILLLYIG